MPFRRFLRADLVEARKDRNSELVSLIRTLIAAIDNAEAVDHVEDDAVTEIARRRLSDDEVMSIIVSEGEELRHAADDFDRRGNQDEAERLRSLSKVADGYAQTFSQNRT